MQFMNPCFSVSDASFVTGIAESVIYTHNRHGTVRAAHDPGRWPRLYFSLSDLLKLLMLEELRRVGASWLESDFAEECAAHLEHRYCATFGGWPDYIKAEIPTEAFLIVSPGSSEFLSGAAAIAAMTHGVDEDECPVRVVIDADSILRRVHRRMQNLEESKRERIRTAAVPQ